MNISEHLKKELWKRRVYEGSEFALPTFTNSYYQFNDTDKTIQNVSDYRFLTQDDFLKETSPDAHKINETYYSQRPIWRLVTKEDGKQDWIIERYEEVEHVALGLQPCFIDKYLSRFAGKGIWIANETTEDKAFEKFCSWRDMAGFDVAMAEFANSCFNTADGAVYWYVGPNNQIEYKVFSYLYGDILFPQIDENGDEVIYRLFSLMGKNCVEIYSPRYIECWIQYDPNTEKDQNWLKKAKGYLKRAFSLDVVSEDGYRRLYRKETQISGLNQCIYLRLNDIPTGIVQSAIESLEKAYSYVAENVRGSAFPMLFLAATKFTSLPPIGASPTIGVKGTPDEIRAAKAEYIKPADMSDIAKLNINTLWSNITRTARVVFIEPEVIKNGSDSSTTIKILFAPEVEWALKMWINFFKPMKQMVEVFKQLVAKVEGEMYGFAKLKLSIGLDPYIPNNVAEEVSNVINKVNARVMSRKAGMTDLADKYVGDYEQTLREWKQEIDMKARIPKVAEAEVNEKYGLNAPTEPSTTINVNDDVQTPQQKQQAKEKDPSKQVDNRDAGKSISKR